MALIDGLDEYRMYQYECTGLDITFDDGVTSELVTLDPVRLVSLSIASNYTRDLFPIIHIQLVMERSLYYKIIKGKNGARLHLRVDKFFRLIGKDEKSLYSKWLDDTFRFILDDDDNDFNESLGLEEERMNYRNSIEDDFNDLYDNSNRVDFYIYRGDDVDKMDKSTGLNNFLQNATIQDGYQYVLNKIGLSKYLIGQMENKKVYSTLFIPNLKARQILRFLDTYYGTWSTGMITFCDYDRAYFMPYTSECTVYAQGERRETCIIVPDFTGDYNNEPCTLYRNDKTKIDYVIADNNTASIRNESISNDYINSNSVTVVNNLTGEVVLDQSLAQTRNGASSQRVAVSSMENPWLSTIYNKYTGSGARVIELTLTNYDIDTIKPNKKFIVYFTNTKTGITNKGNYTLTQAEHFMVKAQSELTLSTHIVLRSDIK